MKTLLKKISEETRQVFRKRVLQDEETADASDLEQEASVVLRGSREMMTQWERYQSSEGFFDH